MENPDSLASHLAVMIVDDEPNLRRSLSIFIEAEGHAVVAVGKTRDALAEAGRRYFDLAIIDLRLGTESDIDLITSLRAICPWMKLVICTAYASINSAVEAMKRGAFDYLSKPFTHDQVAHVIRKVAEIRTLEQKITALQEIYSEAVPEVMLESSSTAMQNVLAIARQVAASEATLLIRGESGTGKNILARAIHSWSNRPQKPFGTVSCPSLSAELLESELFGHAKGAFTGALLDYPGRISVSQGGTLFLDEIADLPLSIQAKLLRLLQEKVYEGVGDLEARKADVRIIAATNTDLESAVKTGKFREDLFYRLNVVELVVPPLRERREDILQIAERFLAFFAKHNHRQVLSFSSEAAQALAGHDWHGNVRELRNNVERAVLLCNGPEVGIHHLFSGPGPVEKLPSVGDPVPLEKIEQLHIRRVLAETRSIEEASRVLQVDSVTLWRKRKKYGI
jgi:NtrC-family two-component system response regulator AlgB